MAIQAQMYSDNLGLPLAGSQDWLMIMDTLPNNNINNNNSNNLFSSCGLNEFSFNLQQKQQQQFQRQQQQQQLFVQLQNLQQRNHHPTTAAAASTTTTSSDRNHNHMTPMNLSQSLASQIEKQRQEIDKYISLQNERLKVALQAQRKQQLGAMLKKVEEKATMLLRRKDEEIATAKKRTMELEEFVRKMEAETQGWQRAAAEKEAMAASLSNQLEELREQACCMASANGVDDAESCCDEAETGDGGERKKMVCRVCNSGNACVLFLPCRHLCSCDACEAFLLSCPLCKSPKRGAIQALLS